MKTWLTVSLGAWVGNETRCPRPVLAALLALVSVSASCKSPPSSNSTAASSDSGGGRTLDVAAQLLKSNSFQVSDLKVRPPTVGTNGGEVDYANPKLFPGKGYDALTGDDKGQCVTYSNKTTFSGPESYFQIEQVESTRTLEEEMNLTASAGLKFAAGFGGSLKVQFSQERKITSYSTFVLAKSIYRAPVENLNGEAFDPRYAGLFALPRGDVLFREKCGDFYVSGDISGGEFYGLIQIDSTDADSKRTLEGNLTVTYGIFSSSTDFTEKLRTVVKDRQMTIRAYVGGGTPKVLTPNPEGLIKMATEFPTTFVNASGGYNGQGVVYKLLLSPYSNLPPFDGGVLNPIVAKQQLLVLDRLNDYAATFGRQINDIDYILKFPDRFSAPDLAALNVARGKVLEMNNRVMRLATQCFRDATTCLDDAAITFLPVELPPMKNAATCTKPLYNEKQDPACGITFKEANGPECGPICSVAADPKCGVKSWNVRAQPPCPPIYKNGQNRACPPVGAYCPEHCMGGDHCYCAPLPIAGVCRVAENGIEGYEACENKAFGVKEYNTCQVCDGYATCRHPNFGIERILSCRRPEFGLERCLD